MSPVSLPASCLRFSSGFSLFSQSRLSLLLLAVVGFVAPRAQATLIDGLSITITSSFNGGPVDSRVVTLNRTAGNPEVVDAGGFGWMIPGDSIDISGSGLNDRFEIYLHPNHSSLGASPQAPLFTDTDYFDFTFTLPTSWSFNAGAIVSAISTQGSATLVDNVMTMHVYDFGQMTGGSAAFEGKFTIIAATSQTAAGVPDPASTAGLLAGAAALGLLAHRRTRRASFAR
ncbi:MAG: hypothetical protein NTV51_17035 [Verrucomicrobia bacterium]|nr:hypothetical protein [Verrucomicrobiota bacterium]